MPPQQFSAILWREQVSYQGDDDEVCFVLDEHAELDLISASSLKQQSAKRKVSPFGHIILIPLGKRRLYLKGTPCSCEERI